MTRSLRVALLAAVLLVLLRGPVVRRLVDLLTRRTGTWVGSPR